MDLFEGSKYAVAIVGALLLAKCCEWLSDALYPVPYLDHPAYNVPGAPEPAVDLASLRLRWPQALGSPADRLRLLGFMRDMRRPAAGSAALEGEASTSAAPAAETLPDFATAIPAADAAAGKETAQRCLQCHVWDKNGPNKIGPDLYGIIGRPRASHPGFSYSSAMTAKGGTWTYDEIFRFVRSPSGYIPGTKMTFIGLPRAQDRLNLLAFMRTWADTPPPLPPHRTTQAAADTSTKTAKAPPAKKAP
jgi:cytochrome c